MFLIVKVHTTVYLKTGFVFFLFFSQPLTNIRKTCPCNIYPPTPHFYTKKNGVCRGIPIFLIFAPKHRMWVLVRTASPRRF